MKLRWLILSFLIPWMLSAEPLTLEQARTLAVSNDKALQAYQSDSQAYTENRRAAFTQFLPSLDFEGGYRRDSDLMHYDTGNILLPIYDLSAGYPQLIQTEKAGFRIDQDLGQKDNVQAVFKATQPLFTGGKIWRNYRIQNELETISRNQADLQRQETLLNVETAYWRVAELSAKVKLANTYRQAVQGHVDELNDYLEAGLITRNDLLKARVKLSEADLSLQQANDGYTLALMDLNRCLGQTSDTPIELADTLSLGSPVESDDITGNPQDRPELQALSRLCRLQREVVGVKRSAYFPQIALQAAYKLTRPNPYDSFKDEYGDVWQISLLCSMNLFNFNRTGNEIAAAHAQQRAAEQRYQDTLEKIDLQIDQARFQLSEAEKRVELARINLEQARENLRETNDRFHDGLLKSSDLLDAQSLWEQANSSLIEALAARNVQITRTRKACGNL